MEPVAPHAGAWIEITGSTCYSGTALSLPMRERGLKYWNTAKLEGHFVSLPMRERGLKYCRTVHGQARTAVAPHAGAWIEISAHTHLR